MPSVSSAQRMAMAIAEHQPSKLFKRNQSLLKMSHSQLHDFASTSQQNLPYKKYNSIPAAIRMRGKKLKLSTALGHGLQSVGTLGKIRGGNLS